MTEENKTQNANAPASLVGRLVSWWRLKQARRTAKKYDLDFEVKCVFDHQLRPYGNPRDGQLCVIALHSGHAIYRAKVTRFWPGNKQKDWRFEFQGYKNS